MSEAIKLLIPLLNPNEREAKLVDLAVKEGQQVEVGQRLFTLETTKSTNEVEAEGEGFILGIQAEEGDTVQAGELFAYLADSPDWKPPAPSDPAAPKDKHAAPEDLRITQPALALAEKHSLDLSELPKDKLITESVVRDLVSQSLILSESPVDEKGFDPEAIIVYGAGGHGKSVIDVIRAQGKYKVVGVIDDGRAQGDKILGVPILGGSETLDQLYAEGTRLAANAVGGIGDVTSRTRVFGKLVESGFGCPALVHPRAVVEDSAQLSPGVQIFPLAYVGSDVRVGTGTIINTGAIVSHDCQLGDYVNISPGTILAGEVEVGDRTLVGMGVTINLNAKIGARCQIGNSAVVKSDVPEGGIVRAGTTWPK